MRKISLAILFSVIGSIGFAQNDMQLTQYMYSMMGVNPSYAGSNKAINGSLMFRKQWLGIEKSPLSQMINVDMYHSKILGGAGLSVINDKLGYEHNLTVRLMYAQHKQITQKWVASAGVAVGIHSRSLDGTQLTYHTSTDPNALFVKENKVVPVIDAGVKLTNGKLEVAFSGTHLNRGNNKSDFFNLPRHMYGFAKYHITTFPDMVIAPSVLFKQRGNVYIVDVSGVVTYKKQLMGGLSYRMQEAVALLVGYRVHEYLWVHYSFDANMGNFQSQSSGSHEIVLKSTLFLEKEYPNVSTPRYMY